MAKVNQPFLSLGGHGTVSSLGTVRRSPGAHVLQSKPTPVDAGTLPQRYQRWLYQDYRVRWWELSDATRAAYAAAAAAYRLTGFMYWMKTCLSGLTGLAGWWKHDTVAGGFTPDSSRSGNPATVIGATLEDGHLGQALHFNGIDQYCFLGIPPELDLLDAVSIEFYLKSDSFPMNSRIIARAEVGPWPQLALWQTFANLFWIISSGGVPHWVVAPAGELKLNVWQYILARYSPTSHILQIDDWSDSIAYSGPIDDMAQPWSVARQMNAASPSWHPGAIDNLRIYDHHMADSWVSLHRAQA